VTFWNLIRLRGVGVPTEGTLGQGGPQAEGQGKQERACCSVCTSASRRCGLEVAMGRTERARLCQSEGTLGLTVRALRGGGRLHTVSQRSQ
jgi:hypothetical protein